MSNEIIAQRLDAILRMGSIVTKTIDVFGSHFIITCHCDKTARRVKALMMKVARNVTMGKDVDYVGDTVNSGQPKRISVYRVGGAF